MLLILQTTPPSTNSSAQLTLVTDGTDKTFAIFKYHKYALPQGNSSCPNQVCIDNKVWFLGSFLVICCFKLLCIIG